MSVTMLRSTIVSCIVLCCVVGCSGQSYDNMTRLMSAVLSGYNTDIRPVLNQSGTVHVNVSLILYNILEVDTVQGVITMALSFSCMWYDERITWTSSDYDGISSIKLQQQYVWVPQLVTSKPTDFTSLGEKWMYVNYQSNGFATWNPGGVYSLACPMNIKHWPFDMQECELSYLTIDSTDTEVFLQPVGFFTDNMLENGEWTLASTSIDIQTLLDRRMMVFSIKLERRVLFFIDTLIIPLFLLSFLSCFVFLLPSESGERVGYCITILLSMTVFLDVVSDEVPKLSNPVPLLCRFLVTGVIMNAVVTILVVLNLLLYHRNNHVPVGKGFRFIVKLARCKKNTVGIENETNKEDGHSKQTSKDKLTELLREKCPEVLEQGELSAWDVGEGETSNTVQGNKPESAGKVTWQEVSVALDRLFFLGSSIISLLSILVMTVMITQHM